MTDVIVTGGRFYKDADKVKSVLDSLRIGRLIQGGATGADLLALVYAERNDIPCVTIAAEWDRLGRAAGPVRNLKMLEQFPSALVVAFPGNDGTRNCVFTALEKGMTVLEVVRLP